MSELRRLYEKTQLPGARMDMVFHQIRIGFFFRDDDFTFKSIERAQRSSITSILNSPLPIFSILDITHSSFNTCYT